MTGVEMMLKSMGFDPIKISSSIGEFQTVMQNIANSLNRIETRQKELDEKVNLLLASKSEGENARTN